MSDAKTVATDLIVWSNLIVRKNFPLYSGGACLLEIRYLICVKDCSILYLIKQYLLSLNRYAINHWIQMVLILSRLLHFLWSVLLLIIVSQIAFLKIIIYFVVRANNLQPTGSGLEPCKSGELQLRLRHIDGNWL